MRMMDLRPPSFLLKLQSQVYMNFSITEHDVDSKGVYGTISIVEINNEALVKDVDLATRLGYSRPRSIRQLITRMIDDGRFGYATPYGAFEKAGNGAEVEVYYLNEKQSLKVISESDTAISYQVMDEVIDVFLAYRNGKLSQTQNNSFDISMMLPEALRALADKTEELNATKQLVIEMKPKVEFAEAVESSKSGILIGAFAKVLSEDNGITIGQNKLFAWLRDSGYLIERGLRHNLPKQQFIDNGFFTVKLRPVDIGDAKESKTTTLITGLGMSKLTPIILNSLKEQ